MKYALCLLLFGLSLIIKAQPVAQFVTMERHMGDIAWLMPAETYFEVKNAGTQPLQLLDVRTDCGCAQADWSQQPIEPGKTAKIQITYNAELLGSFEKLIAVTTNAEAHPIYLHLKGRVVKEVVYSSSDFDIHIGDFHLSTDDIDFDNVKMGDTPKQVVKILNGSSRALHPALMHMPEYLTAVATPDVILPGKVGELTFILNSKRIKDFGLTQTTIYLSRFVGDKISEENALNVAATILPDVRQPKGKYAYVPRLELSDTTLVFSAFGKKKKLTQSVLLKNTGNAPLNVSRLQVYNPGIGVKLNKSVIQPGEEAKLKITLHNSGRKRGKRSVLLITNDPNLPKTVIHVEQEKVKSE